MMKGTLAKNIRRKSAIDRLQTTIANYQQEIVSLNEGEQNDDIQSRIVSLKKKIDNHQTTILNTRNNISKHS